MLPQLVKDPAAYCIEYSDGTRATLLVLHGADRDFTFSARVAGHGLIATQFFRSPVPNVNYSAGLTAKVEQMFMTRIAPFPVQPHLAHQRHSGRRHDIRGPAQPAARNAPTGGAGISRPPNRNMPALESRCAKFGLATSIGAAVLSAQTNPLWHEQKTKNYLPDMTWPEVQDLLTRTDIAVLPLTALEQHGPQLPIGTDYFAGVEQAKLIAQRTDVPVVPILFPGISPYHMEFPGTIALSPDTVQRVYFEAAQSLVRHGIRRILFIRKSCWQPSGLALHHGSHQSGELPLSLSTWRMPRRRSCRSPHRRRQNSIATQE